MGKMGIHGKSPTKLAYQCWIEVNWVSIKIYIQNKQKINFSLCEAIIVKLKCDGHSSISDEKLCFFLHFFLSLYAHNYGVMAKHYGRFDEKSKHPIH